jgi:hypothetical protein
MFESLVLPCFDYYYNNGYTKFFRKNILEHKPFAISVEKEITSLENCHVRMKTFVMVLLFFCGVWNFK